VDDLAGAAGSAGCGTFTHAAPENLLGLHCGPSADIYRCARKRRLSLQPA